MVRPGTGLKLDFETFVDSLCRHHDCADDDHAEYGGEGVSAARVLRDGHGPFRHRLLPVRLCRPDGIRHPQLLLQLHPHGNLHGPETPCKFATPYHDVQLSSTALNCKLGFEIERPNLFSSFQHGVLTRVCVSLVGFPGWIWFASNQWFKSGLGFQMQVDISTPFFFLSSGFQSGRAFQTQAIGIQVLVRLAHRLGFHFIQTLGFQMRISRHS